MRKLVFLLVSVKVSELADFIGHAFFTEVSGKPALMDNGNSVFTAFSEKQNVVGMGDA
jgi:hypothetical protein